MRNPFCFLIMPQSVFYKYGTTHPCALKWILDGLLASQVRNACRRVCVCVLCSTYREQSKTLVIYMAGFSYKTWGPSYVCMRLAHAKPHVHDKVAPCGPRAANMKATTILTIPFWPPHYQPLTFFNRPLAN